MKFILPLIFLTTVASAQTDSMKCMTDTIGQIITKVNTLYTQNTTTDGRKTILEVASILCSGERARFGAVDIKCVTDNLMSLKTKVNTAYTLADSPDGRRNMLIATAHLCSN